MPITACYLNNLMKTNRSTRLLTAALGLAVLTATGCAEKDKTASTTTTPAASPPSTMHDAIAATDALAASTWASIKDATYDGRTLFVAGVANMEAELDNQITALTQKRAALASSTDTTNWDLAMKELETARVALKSSGAELSKATADTWSQAKDKVNQAWIRTQDAVAKVKASTTH